MALQWYKQPDGTMILWDPQDPSNPLSQSPQGKQTTDTTDVARSLLEDKQQSRAPDLLSQLLNEGGGPMTEKGGIDYGKVLMALIGSSTQDQSIGATTPEGAGYSPAYPTTGEETSRPAKNVEAYSGGKAFVEGMIKRGWTPEEAAGLAGNVHVESGFKPGVKSSVKNEQSYGFMQWNKQRLDGLKNYAASTKRDWHDPEVQMDWINLERNGGSTKYGGTNESAAYSKALDPGGSASQIAARIGRFVERPKDLSQSVNIRMGAADKYAALVGQPTEVARATVPTNNIPYSNQSADEELFSAILGGQYGSVG